MKMNSKEKQTHGGKRPGAGRPKKPETTTISFRVLKDKAVEISNRVREVIKEITS